MSNDKDIRNQIEQLLQLRQNVQILLAQINAHGGWMHAPLAQLNSLIEQRREIAQCKAVLRGWQAQADDHPNDGPAQELGFLEQQISELEQSLRFPLPEAARQPLALLLQGAQERRRLLEAGQTLGPVVAAPLHAERDVYIATQQTIHNGDVQQFFTTQPLEGGEALLNAYLDALSHECEYLRLSRIMDKRQTGAERPTAPSLRLQAVYAGLTTDRSRVLEQYKTTVAQVLEARDQVRGPDDVPPEQVRLPKIRDLQKPSMHEREPDYTLLQDMSPDTPCTLLITRPELALETIATQRRLVLLGEPGAGKSTVLRYLALLLAQQRLHAGVEPLPGWIATDLPIPILCPLARVATALPSHNGDALKALYQILSDLLDGEHGQYAGLRDHLRPALRGDGVLLLFDGLDELPVDTSVGGISPRVAVAEAIRHLASKTRARIVVTSRVLPYHAATNCQLPEDEGWEVRTIQPLRFGQVCTFVTSWYDALVDSGVDSELNIEGARVRAEALINELRANPALHPLVASPLLLTMLAILHHNNDTVPRDRARLYDECVQLLLERWEPVRTPGLRRPSLLERLGNLPGLELDLLRGALHELAFKAHDRPPSDDGRGVIDGDALSGRMLRLFTTLRSPDPAQAVMILAQVLREDAGILQARADNMYTFPHLTFQEYLAACHLANQHDMIELVQARWHSVNAERWREVLRLLVGRLRQQEKIQDKLIPWLERLTALRQGRQMKLPTTRRHDAVLATLVYSEQGEAVLASSMVDIEDQIEKPLRKALLDLLTEHDPAIATADRVRAGFLLGNLGDPRFPITITDWQNELKELRASGKSDYFCRVEAGTYWIGSGDDDLEAEREEKPRHQVTFEAPFWIGRYPITNAQWQLWVDAGGHNSYSAHNTDLNRPNQPVVSITWDMAVAFCTWLSDQLGVVVRLPHEKEWEAAARGQEERRYPWGNEWSKDRAATGEDRETRGWRWSVPVGCYPSGAAACGALDMAGNVWEWTMDVWQPYSGTKKPLTHEERRMMRGGGYGTSKARVRCSTRFRLLHHASDRGWGLRIVLPAL